MADISITISADPNQAVQSIRKVQRAGEDLAVTSKKLSQTSASETSTTVNQVQAVSRAARREFEQTSASVSGIGSGIRTAAGEASKVAGAFGAAVPVVGRLGSAIASAITGPVGAISAAIGLAIAAINDMIRQSEDRVRALRASAGAQAGAAYEALMQGRQDYDARLQALSQVKQLNRMGRETGLDEQGVATLKSLAAQVGIDERHISASGVDSGEVSAAAKRLRRARSKAATEEYSDYLEALNHQLRLEIKGSSLRDETKAVLSGMNVFDAAAHIKAGAIQGRGVTMDEFRSWQDLYALVKPLAEVKASYERDAMLGRSQRDLNEEGVEAAKKVSEARTAEQSAIMEESRRRSAAIEAERKEIDKAAAARASEEQRRQDAAAKLTDGLEREIHIQKLVNEGKEREAFIQRQVWSMESALGRDLRASELADLEQRSGSLFDLRHIREPSLAPEAAVSARSRMQSYSMPLDRLQRIGANITNPAASPELRTMTRQLTVVEEIRNLLRTDFSLSRQVGGAIFP